MTSSKKKKNRIERSELVAIESAWHNCEQDVKGKVFLRPECLAWSNPFKKNLGTVIGGSVTSKSHWHQGTSCFIAGGVEGQHLRLLLSIHKAEALLCNGGTPSAKHVPTGRALSGASPATDADPCTGGRRNEDRSTFHPTRYKKWRTVPSALLLEKSVSYLHAITHKHTCSDT